MSDALAKVRSELGRDAVILHTRTVRRGGLFGIGARSLVEITATSDPRLTVLRAPAGGPTSTSGAAAGGAARRAAAEARPQPLPPPANWPPKAAPEPVRQRGSAGGTAVSAASKAGAENMADTAMPPMASGNTAGTAMPRDTLQAKNTADTAVPPVVPPAASAPHPFTLIERPNTPEAVPAPSPAPMQEEKAETDSASIAVLPPRPVGDAASSQVRVLVNSDPVLRTEVSEIRAMVQDLLRQSEQVRPPQVPAGLVEYYSQLVGQDVARELVVQLLERVAVKLEQQSSAVYWDAHGRPVGGRSLSAECIRQELERQVMEMVPPAAPLALTAQGRPTVVAVVGPTGVGKTTTIAKLAANMKLREGKKVGLITIDTFRIAAVEQLRTYAEILHVPLVAVTTPDEMPQAVRQMGDVDLILIDTAGRSQKDELRIAELSRFLSAVQLDQVHLVLSSTSREEAIREAIRNFSVLGAQQVIFTKLDEAVGFGVILNVLRSVDMRLSYLTNGQSVPADIEVGSAHRVAQLVLGTAPRPAPMLAEPAAPCAVAATSAEVN